MKLHPLQQKLLKVLPNLPNVADLSLREIGGLIGASNPQQVRHHIQQLENKGFLRWDTVNNVAIILKQPIDDIVYLPLFATAECGPSGFLAQENAIDQIPVSSKAFGIADPSPYCLVRTRGKSMEPRIHEGDSILVKFQSDISTDSIYLVLHENVPKVKLIKKIDSTHIALCSINEAFKAEIVDVNKENFFVLGVVKSIISKLD